MRILFLFVLIVFSISNPKTFAQCEDDDFMDNCANLLESYTFIKSFIHTDAGTGKKPKIPMYSVKTIRIF
jgi:hypothetical protein